MSRASMPMQSRSRKPTAWRRCSRPRGCIPEPSGRSVSRACSASPRSSWDDGCVEEQIYLDRRWSLSLGSACHGRKGIRSVKLQFTNSFRRSAAKLRLLFGIERVILLQHRTHAHHHKQHDVEAILCSRKARHGIIQVRIARTGAGDKLCHGDRSLPQRFQTCTLLLVRGGRDCLHSPIGGSPPPPPACLRAPGGDSLPPPPPGPPRQPPPIPHPPPPAPPPVVRCRTVKRLHRPGDCLWRR